MVPDKVYYRVEDGVNVDEEVVEHLEEVQEVGREGEGEAANQVYKVIQDEEVGERVADDEDENHEEDGDSYVTFFFAAHGNCAGDLGARELRRGRG